ncbi:MAG: hypothetical protein HOP18_19820 [Deltaproteobacteria bacterium]|nr:hypothetical protein [Deltaproteobacteria bacterium]
MMDRTHVGARCTTRSSLRTPAGVLPQGSQGTIVHEMENLGRQLLLVRWDSGFSVPTLADEIEIESPHDPQAL